MKKFLAVLLAALLIALALWVTLRVQQANRQIKASELLPAQTLALVQIPNLKHTRAQWRTSDLYALWHELAVQEWLREPLAQLEAKRGHGPSLAEFVELGPRGIL